MQAAIMNAKRIKHFLSRFSRKINYFKTYSQLGEDLIIKNYFNSIGVSTPSYIDLGAYDPFSLSNTALFYESGSNGINIEPNPFQFQRFLKYRPKDINLNIGIGAKEGCLDYYVISSSVLNTFSLEQAKEYESEWGYKILEIIPVQVKTLSWIIENKYDGKFPNFLSIDIEGLESEIIQEMKLINSLPSLICIETLSFARNSEGAKRKELMESIVNLGFEFYADTHLNTIFIRK